MENYFQSNIPFWAIKWCITVIPVDIPYFNTIHKKNNKKQKSKNNRIHKKFKKQ